MRGHRKQKHTVFVPEGFTLQEYQSFLEWQKMYPLWHGYIGDDAPDEWLDLDTFKKHDGCPCRSGV